MLEHGAALAIFAALVLYALTGGADFGGGAWDLAASGPRKEEQRALIARAIGPIWEANHVWLILALVVLFTAFPPALAAMATALHVPLTLLLLGIVLRGAAFAFRSNAKGPSAWGRWFAIGSTVTPVLLGTIVGALTSGEIRVAGDGTITAGSLAWLSPFALATGAFTLALFAYLAAVYLGVEAPAGPLRDDFRRRALVAWGATAGLALVVGLLAASGAPRLLDALARRPAAKALPIGGAVFALGALAALVRRRLALARALAIGEVLLILGGWALAQYPCLVAPDVTIADAAAPRPTLAFLLAALASGGVILLPVLAWLFRLFKGQKAFAITGD